MYDEMMNNTRRLLKNSCSLIDEAYAHTSSCCKSQPCVRLVYTVGQTHTRNGCTSHVFDDPLCRRSVASFGVSLPLTAAPSCTPNNDPFFVGDFAKKYPRDLHISRQPRTRIPKTDPFFARRAHDKGRDLLLTKFISRFWS